MGVRFYLLLLLSAALFACSQSDAGENDVAAAFEKAGYYRTPDQFATASSRGDEQAVALFIESGMDLNAPGHSGLAPLMASAQAGRIKTTELLLANGADANAATRNGWTALMYAIAKRDSLEMAQLLVKKGADVNGKTSDGTTPLMIAAQAPNSIATVRFLLESGARVNDKSNFGDTALTMAAENGSAAETVLMLLYGGADDAMTTERGETAYQLAKKGGFEEISRILEPRQSKR